MGGRGAPTLLNCYPLFPAPYPLSFHILAHSFAFSCTHKKLNPLVFKGFRTVQKHRGVGYPFRLNPTEKPHRKFVVQVVGLRNQVA